MSHSRRQPVLTAKPAAKMATRIMSRVISAGGIWRRAVDEVFPVIWEQNLATARENGWVLEKESAYCWRCGVTMHASGVTQRGCAACLSKRPAWSSFTRLGPYQPPLSDWIVDMKFHDQWQWTKWFGSELANRIHAPKRVDRAVICPVPMHWARRWKRGYNQSLLIARAVSRAWGLPLAELLEKTRATTPQVRVAHSQRRDNVRGAFRARRVDLTGWDVWLIDDVKTTGATLTECTRQLKRAGAAEVRAATVAVAGG